MTTVGRLRELEVLGRVVAAAEGGAGGTALIEGEAGIGKSHLLDALAGRATSALVLRGRAWEEGGAPPSWPWREVVSGLAAAIDWADTANRFAVYEQVKDALREAARLQPLLVLLDDMHAADADTIALTRVIARSIRDLPIALVLAARPTPLLAPIAHDSVQVTLGPLSTEDIATLADYTAPFPLSQHARDDIARVAEGNPLFAHELALSSNRADGRVLPERLRDAVLERVADLSSTDRGVLDTAAVLGRQFDVADVAALADRTVDDVLARLGAAAEAGVVTDVSGAAWRFSHQLVRDALYASMPAQARLEVHAAAADRLASVGGDARLGEQARHLIAAVPVVDRDHAIDAAVRAAAQASASRAFNTAVDALRSAVALADDRRLLALLLALGDAQLGAGHVSDAWETFDRAFVLARAAHDDDAATRALLGRTELVPSTGEVPELAGLVEQALKELDPAPTASRIRLLARYARLAFAAGAHGLAAPVAIEAVAGARALDDDLLLSEVLTVRHFTLGGPDDVEDAARVSDELVAVAARSGDAERVLEAEMARLVDRLRLGDISGVDHTLEHLRQLAGATGLARHRFFLESRRGMRAFLAGRLAEGAAMLERAYRIGTEIEEPDAEAVFHGARVVVLADLLDAQEVLAGAYHAEAVAAAIGETRILVFAAYARSSVDDRAAAARLIDQALAPDFGNIPRDGSWLMVMCMAAYVIARSPGHARTTPLYELLLPYRGRIVVNDGAVTFGGVVDHYLGLLSAAGAAPDTAAVHFDDAIAAYQRLGATLFLARARQSRDQLGAAEIAAPRSIRRALLRRSSGEWECGYADATFHLAHMVGLQHIGRLVAAAGEEVHVLQLASPGSGQGSAPQSLPTLLDPQAKRIYRRRVADLRDDIDEADANNDYERADRLRAELDALIDELRRAVGLGGRDRIATSDAERARVAVRKAITAALDRLAEHDSAFAQHLRIHIGTGTYCRYEADPTNPIEWDL